MPNPLRGPRAVIDCESFLRRQRLVRGEAFILWSSRVTAGGEVGDRLREQFAAEGSQARVQCRCRKSSLERNPSLGNDVACVHLFAHPMDRDARVAVVSKVSPENRIGAAVARQQGRMHVETTMPRQRKKSWRQDVRKRRHDDEIGVRQAGPRVG